MSHYFDVPLSFSFSLSIVVLTPGMVDTAGMGTLIFPRGAALPRPARLLTAHLAAIALPTVACHAHQHFGLAASARIGTCADQVFGIHLQIPPDFPNELHASMVWTDYDRRIGGGIWCAIVGAHARRPMLVGRELEQLLDKLSPTAPTWRLLVATPSIQTVAQHFLYFFPDPQGHGSLRPTLCDTAGCLSTMRCPKPFIAW